MPNQRSYWINCLKNHDWYIKLEDFLETTIFPLTSPSEDKQIRKEFYELVDSMLQKKEIPLSDGLSVPNFDEGRKDIDTIVVHHTGEEPDLTLERLSAIGLIRQYAKAYLEDNMWERSMRGQAIWSGHFNKKGNMTFYAYHWLIRPNGKRERLLKDSEIGHHAGEQSINERSIGIALAGNYSDSEPPKKQLESLKELIKSYSDIKQVVGHKDVRPDRTCPGRKWDKWKTNLSSNPPSQ